MVVPALTPVTNPELSIVATKGLEETHGFTAAGEPVPLNWVVNPTHAFKVPVIAGNPFMVTVAVIWHPFELV